MSRTLPKCDHLRVLIGGVVLEIHAQPDDIEYYRSSCWGRFVVPDSDGPPDIMARVHYGSPPRLVNGAPDYDSGGVWRLYRQTHHSGWVAEFTCEGSIYKVARFDRVTSTLHVYLPEAAERYPATYPLDFPLDELLFAEYLSTHDGVELHCCALKVREHGAVFCGVSGAGKSTLARLWEGAPDVTILTDDRAIVRRSDEGPVVFGTPWHGDAGLSAQGWAPLRYLFLLRHGPLNAVRRLSLAEAARRAPVVAVGPFWDRAGAGHVLSSVGRIVQELPCVELTFRPDREVVEFLLRRYFA
ncbi:MAG: hypothetical protein AB1486_30160 [Planctomycetota bacterium]